jgi:hypothetical protein
MNATVSVMRHREAFLEDHNPNPPPRPKEDVKLSPMERKECQQRLTTPTKSAQAHQYIPLPPKPEEPKDFVVDKLLLVCIAQR